MEENNNYLKNLFLNFGKEDYTKYQNELEIIMKEKKDEYSQLYTELELINKRKIKMAFLLFSHYKNWIFPSISNNYIISFNNSSSENKYMNAFKRLNHDLSLDEKLFILWYFYLLFELFYKVKNNQNLTNIIRYLLLETNKVISILYEKKNISINNIFIILDFCLLSFEHFVNSLPFINLHESFQNIIKILFFKNYFDLIQNISLVAIKLKNYDNFKLILNYFKKIKNNYELNDEINKRIIINNNMIQNFINNLLENINNIQFKKEIPKYKEDLIDFYTHFLKYNYKISNLFSNFIETARHSFTHLYNFKLNKNKIIEDISKNNFNTSLLDELYTKETNKSKAIVPLSSSFLFSSKKSIISFKAENIELNKGILFFSFQIGKDENNNKAIQYFPLMIIKKKVRNKVDFKVFLNIFLKKIVSNEKKDDKYYLCISKQIDSDQFDIINQEKDKFEINSNITYYCSILFKDNKVVTYLYYEEYKIYSLQRESNIESIIKDNTIIFIIGNDDKNSFYKGKIGPIVMIENPKNEKNINKKIFNILSLKDKYSDYLLSKFSNYYFDLKEYYQQLFNYNFENDNISEEEEKEKENQEISEIKGKLQCLLYFHPNMLKYSESRIINNIDSESTKKHFFKIISDYNNKDIKYSLIFLEISIINYENIKNLFINDNGFNYICLQLEYYNQFARYYLLKNKNNDIYTKEEIETIMKEIIISLQKNILLLVYNSYSKYLYSSYKKILVALYNCILNLSKITPIISDIFNELSILKEVFRGVLLKAKYPSFDINDLTENNFSIIQNDNGSNDDNKEDNELKDYKSFLYENISNYIGIIETLLTPNFYNISQKEQCILSIKKIFENLLSNYTNFEANNITLLNINISFYENIFYKLIYFVEKITHFFIENNDEYHIIEDNGQKKLYIDILRENFKLLINILITKDKKFSYKHSKKIFKYVFGNNKNNFYIIYSYLDVISYFFNNFYTFEFKKEEINLLKIFLVNFMKNQKVEPDLKIKIECFAVNILIEFIFSNPNKNKATSKIFNFIEDYFNENLISKEIFSQIINIFKKFFIDIFDDDYQNNKINNNFTKDETMVYFWNLFRFLIKIIKILKSNKENYDKKDMINYINDIINVLSNLHNKIKKILTSNKPNSNIIIYQINFCKFINYIIYDNEYNFLSLDEMFLQLVSSAYDICFDSTLLHSNIYILIKEKESSEQIESKKLISKIFFDFYMIDLQHIYENRETLSENNLTFINHLTKIIENRFTMAFNYSNYNLKKNTEFDDYKTIFFISDFLKIFSDKKLSKKYEKNKIISQRLDFYREMKEIMLDIDSNDNSDNTFDFYFISYYFYEIFEFLNQIDFYLENMSNSSNMKIIKQFKELRSELFKFNTIILNDHININLLYKDFFNRKIHNIDNKQKYLLKSIQTILFDKKNKNKIQKELVNLVLAIQNELSFFDDKETEGRNSHYLDLKKLESITDNKQGNNQKKKAKFFSFYRIKALKNKEEEKEKEENKDENINEVNIENKEGGIYDDFNMIDNDNGNYIDNDINNGINNNIINNDNLQDNKSSNSNSDEESNEEEDGLNENSIPKLVLFEDLFSKNIFDKVDKSYITNPKKELMKTIFGIYFEEFFFNNETFNKMKNYYLNYYNDTKPDSKQLNFPSKIKSFTNSLEPSLFLKENKTFFISKIFTVTHKYFYNYMGEHNILNEPIILLRKPINISPINSKNDEKENDIKEEKQNKVFDCELIKLDKVYYGEINILNSINGEFLLFKEKRFLLYENEENFLEEFGKNFLSLSSLEFIASDNLKRAKKKAKNRFLDEDIYPGENLHYLKTIVIFYSEIEEVVEKRFLYYWQGFEIFLKNGKSYFFNMLNNDNYTSFINALKNINKRKDIIFREKDFLSSKKSFLTQNWIDEKLDTYEYLLFLNKYGSRSLNDVSQYYVFPWILIDFKNLIDINNTESEIYDNIIKKLDEDAREQDNNNEENEGEENINIEDKDLNSIKYYNNFRKLKYPVGAQTKSNRENLLEKYEDEEGFRSHFGTHYSTGSYIFYYLMRLEPFTSLLVELQNYNQENPDRMLNDLKETIKIINSGIDSRELIPELFSKIDYFININCVYYGNKKQSQIIVDDIEQIWNNYTDLAYNSISIDVRFIIEHKKLLNSKTIAVKINNWIDNVFGIGQLPPPKKRESSYNIFQKTSYSEAIDLKKKLNKCWTKEKDIKKIKKKIINKINLVISFGQTPYKVFKEKHLQRKTINLNKKVDIEEENPENYGHQDEYLGNDFLETFLVDNFKKEDNEEMIKTPGIYMETNSYLGKIFVLTESNELGIISTTFYNFEEAKEFHFNEIFCNIKIPYICFLDKLTYNNNIDFYIYKINYSFSSFPQKSSISQDSSPYLYPNLYIKNISKNNEIKDEYFYFMTCRHTDNSFKLYTVINQKKIKKIETYSYVCEDFVMSCKAISPNSFIIGLNNGKLIKILFKEQNYKINKEKNKNKNSENIDDKFTIIYNNYIQGHNGSINMIEIDEKIGVVLTGGDDNKLCIRKLYDFELLTCIKLKSKFLITMAKISPMNFIYIMCYNKINKKSIIFGYTLSGIKFAKSMYSYYTSLDFTKNGNIISLVNECEINILFGYNLEKIIINKNDKDYEKYLQIQKGIKDAKWMQFNYFKNYYGRERNIISYLSKNSNENEYYLKTLKVTNISYFD